MTPRWWWSRRAVGLAVALLGLATGLGVGRADPLPEGIDEARTAVDAELEARLAACARRFVVASCQEAARAEHTRVVAELRLRRIQRDEAEHRRAAAARRGAPVDPSGGDPAAQAGQPAAQAGASAGHLAGDEVITSHPATATPRDRPPPRPTTPLVPRAPARPTAASTASDEQRGRERFEARQREIAIHREAVERRQAERAAAGKIAPPLPSQ